MRLEYQIAADPRQLKTVLRGVEGEAKASAKRTAAAVASASKPRAARERDNDAHVRARTRFLLSEETRIAKEQQRQSDYWHRTRLSQARQRHQEELRHARTEQRTRASTARSIVGGAARGVTGTIGTVARFAGGAAGILGGIAIGNALSDQLEVRKRSSQLANQAGNPALKGELAQSVQGVRGFTGTEALEGLTKFVDVTGDLGAARSMLTDMSRVALATTTDLGELGSAMGTAFIPIADAIKDPTERIKAMNSVMRATAGMGAVGAVEVKDLASEMAGLAATSSRFAGSADQNLNMMVAFAQAARQRGGASSASEAVTSVQRFASDLLTQPAQKRLGALGVDVFTDKTRTQLKGADEILVDVLQKTKGDQVKLQDIFGERGFRATMGFAPLFTQAEAANAKLPAAQRQAAGAAGTAAVRAELTRLLKASISEAQIDERVASRMDDPDMKIKEAIKDFNNKVGSELIPVLTRLLPEFTHAIPTIAKFTSAIATGASYLLDNPYKGIAGILAAKVSAELAGGFLRETLQNGLQGLLGGGAAGALKIGSIGMAVGTVAIAANELVDLSHQTGGFEGILAGIGGILNGDGFAKGVDDFLNERAAKVGPEQLLDSEKIARGIPLGPAPTALDRLPTGAAAGFFTQGQQGQAAPQSPAADLIAGLREGLAKATTDQQAAAKGLLDAATALKGAAGNSPEASRVAPIVSPSRG